MQMHRSPHASTRACSSGAKQQALLGAAQYGCYAELWRRAAPEVVARASPNPQQGGGYYPPIPPANPLPAYTAPNYVPTEPSAPPSPYASSAYSTPLPEDYSQTSSYVSSVSEAEQLAVQDQEELRASAGTTRTLSFLGFWLQFALSVVSAGILLFSVAFVPKPPGFSVGDISKYLTLAGVIASFVSALFAHGFLTLSRKLINGGNVARGYMQGTLLTNNAICLAGIAITVIGLQASVGTLVAKSLMTAMSGPYQYGAAAGGLVSLDVFALQASTNTLLCHVIGLLYTNLMLRVVNKSTKLKAA